jgi:hypothetical protein
MEEFRSVVEPLSARTRQRTFLFLVLVFCVVIPVLYMYATGYRLDFKRPTNFVSTGGLSITVPLTEAEMYLDDMPVEATRTFRRAFYAQGIDVGTHKIHVQRDGYHTWVKELPVSKHLVTEAEVFNLPLIPQIRVITRLQTATGTMIVPASFPYASTTNAVLATSTASSSRYVINPEYVTRMGYFGTTSTSTKKETAVQQIRELITVATTSVEDTDQATTTKIQNGVKLMRAGDEVVAEWVGPFEQMPYYYCAPSFPRYSTISPSTTVAAIVDEVIEEVLETEKEGVDEVKFVVHPVQVVPEDTTCEPVITMDRKSQRVHDFQFYPSDSDLVLLVLDDGIYVSEIDDRSWQNVQPLIRGENLRVSIDGSAIYVYDGTIIYQVLPTLTP